MKSTIRAAARRPVVASDYRIDNRSERAVGSNGEVNASSTADLLRNNIKLVQAAARGSVRSSVEMMSMEQRLRDRQVNNELIVAAFKDKQAQVVLGERIAKELYMTGNRKGFMRRFMNRNELQQGEIPRFPVRTKNVRAAVMTSRTRMETQFMQDKWLMPSEFIIGTRIFVNQIDLNQNTGGNDVLEEKYVEALEAIMVAEDRMWYKLNNALVGVDNNRQIISGTLSPQSLMNVRQQVVQWGLKAAYCLMASDLMVDIAGDAGFGSAAGLEPVSKHEIVMTGEIATLYGMSIITEAYRHPEHKVLSAGEFIIVSDAMTHGAYSDRNGIDSAPIDVTTERTPGRGWVLNETVAMAVANSRSTCLARRV